MTLVRLEPAALWSRVKHSTTEPLRSLSGVVFILLIKVKMPTIVSGSIEHEKKFIDLRPGFCKEHVILLVLSFCESVFAVSEQFN